VLTRWLLGALMVYMGWVKAVDPVDFLKLVRQYDLVQSPMLLNSIAAMLPWFEVFCGLLLLAGVAVRGAAAMLLLMLMPFTAVVLDRALVIHSATGVAFCAVRFDCGCGAGEIQICHKLLENGVMVFLSAWLLTGRGRRCAARYTLRRSPQGATPQLQEG
jgi:uncharacterized membrane protein YphA (DoxX/SURF4 family)